MKRIISFLILILLIISLSVIAEDSHDYDFRNVNWGMNQSEIIEKEGEPTQELDNGTLVYEISLFNLKALLYYVFREEKLTEASYYFVEDYMTSYNQYIKDYKKMNDKLKNKYGEPDEYHKNYSNEFLKNQGDATCLQLGYLEYLSGWETDKVRILHRLFNTGDFGEYGQAEIAHLIYYESVEYYEIIKKDKQEKIEENL